jgi:hypothetical protein
MGIPAKIKLNDHYKGDYWEGMVVGPVLIDDAQPANSLASVRIQFRDEYDQLGHEFNTTPGAGIGTITIDDANTWEITVPPQLLNLDANPLESGMSNSKTWYWDFETTDSTGAILTLYRGTIKVKEDVSS